MRYITGCDIFHFPQQSASFPVHEFREMEMLSSKFIISLTQTKFPATCWMNPLLSKTLGSSLRCCRFTVHSKKSSYPDFQEYAKPKTLLPATQVKVHTDAAVEKAVDSSASGSSKSLYKVKLQTSELYGSGLTDVNSGILLCLIDENGSAILQRLPVILIETDTSSEDKVVPDALHFQRGSTDEFAFEGPNLGRITAVWIGLESGQWRTGGVSLTVICDSQPSPVEENQKSKQLTGLQYSFKFEDVLLGEKGDFSMMEFRPHSVTALSENEALLFNNKSVNALPSVSSYLTANEESMKEYADLKFSLLFYDAVLVLAGSSVASFSIGENATYAFLTGGLCGFFYLLLLQRSVDGLPAGELIPSDMKGGFGQVFGRLRGPISSVVLAFAFAIIAAKYVSGEDGVKMTAKELMFGMMGFLVCKVSVVLAAFKPITLGFRDNKQNL